MSQDILSDGLNQMMNALRANKDRIVLKKHSKLLLSVLAIAKLKNYVKEYSVDKEGLLVVFDKLNSCKSIKPRHPVSSVEIEKYTKRYLPAKNLGIVLISTDKGVITHQTALDKNIGGCLLAYMY